MTIPAILRARGVGLGLALWLAASCTGDIGLEEEMPPGELPPTPGGKPGPGSGAGVPVEVGGSTPGAPGAIPGKTYKALHPVPATMLRLTGEQYLNTIADLFGSGIKPATALEEDETTEVFFSIGAAKVGTSPLGVEQYQQAALAIADQVLRDRARQGWLAGCAPDRAEDPCVARAIETIGYRLWRRPLTAEEVQRYVRLVGADGAGRDKVEAGLRYALATLLQSPHFLYLPAIGEPDAATGFQRFTGFELASRLAYFLWNSTPDLELLEAARAGRLSTKAGIDAEVKRMLGKPRARSVASRFFAEFWKVTRLSVDSKSTKAFPAWNAALLAAYRRELDLFVEDLVFGRDADVRETFDARQTLADATLAKIYGMGGGTTTFSKMTLPETRTGLLTSGAVIAANSPSDRSSPTHRGVFLLERVLCREVPPPPVDVNDQLPENPPGATPRSVRERLELHRTNPACAGCHALFDPIGLTFENFDGIGVHRSLDAGKPIDPTGELEGKVYRGVREVASFLRSDPRPPACLTRHLYSFAAGHEVEEGEEGVIEALSDTFVAGGHRVQSLLREVASSPGFRYFAREK